MRGTPTRPGPEGKLRVLNYNLRLHSEAQLPKLQLEGPHCTARRHLRGVRALSRLWRGGLRFRLGPKHMHQRSRRHRIRGIDNDVIVRRQTVQHFERGAEIPTRGDVLQCNPVVRPHDRDLKICRPKKHCI